MIEIKKLTKAYGKQVILNDVNFNFSDRGLLCILGASGCGKSTLLNLIAGFDTDYQGDIIFDGTQLNQLKEVDLCEYRKQKIGFIFQDYHLLSGYTVLENILLASDKTKSKEENKKEAEALLLKMGIDHKVNEKVENLSGGQKQRVAIARSLIRKPALILADEPTGALDRNTSDQIMEILKELSQECLVLVITHDSKICTYADQVLSIERGLILGDSCIQETPRQPLNTKKPEKEFIFQRGFKNFKVHIQRYLAIAFAISLGVCSLLLSLSFRNVMEESITQFKEKNIAYNNGYIKIKDNQSIFETLKTDGRIEQVYYQYKLYDLTLTFEDNAQTISEKFPMPKASESLSFGRMPQKGKNEISLSPSLAKKYSKKIDDLIGKEFILKYQGQEIKLTMSGIFNAGYDDFFISSDIEQNLYKDLQEKNAYAISYDVTNFEDILPISNFMKEKNIVSIDASKEVSSLMHTFDNLNRLFLIVTILIQAIGLFISSVLLIKLQNSRYKEIGLYAALGYHKRTIRSMIIAENISLSMMTAIFSALLLGAISWTASYLNISVSITLLQVILSMCGSSAIVLFISMLASRRLIKMKPADALRK